MIIKYQFVNENVSIDVSDEWGNVVHELDRQEYNNNHTERRRHISLDGISYEGEAFADPIDTIGMSTDSMKLANAIFALQPQQRDLLWKIYFEGYGISEIAHIAGISNQAIHKRLKKIFVKLKNNLG